MLISGIVLGLVLGLVAGGTIWNLSAVRLRRVEVIAVAVLVRFLTEAAIGNGIPAAEQFRLPLYALAYLLLLVGLWANRSQPGISLAFVGILGNGIAIVANAGHMPIWEPSLVAAGLSAADVRTAFHAIIPPTLDGSFLLHAGPLADVIPIPFPIVRNVASVGDLFLTSGLAFFLFATVVRSPAQLEDEEEVLRLRPRLGRSTGPRPEGISFGEARLRAETAILPAEASALDVEAAIGLGAAAGPVSTQAEFRPLRPETATADAGATGIPGVAIPIPGREAVERARRHPYVRLALNSSFSALWTGQVISLFGDRVHQIALAFLVLSATQSPIALAAVFIAATIPNLLFSPVAGTFVDRWDQHEVLVVSDLLRAALVLLIPAAAGINLLLVYPLTFAITTISVFFRPARVAVLPRIVHDEDLLTANSATWIAENLADIVGYPLAGLFVAFLGAALPLAFWIDAATYILSAALLWTIVVPPVIRRAGAAIGKTSFGEELREGWRFLRTETTLLANTLQATVAQFTLGILLVLTPIYVTQALGAGNDFQARAYYGFLETGIGLGNLVGGFVIGLLGARWARGRTVIVGYAAAGACIALLGVTGHVGIAFGLMTGLGVANMVFVIPSQTMFQERTPQELMGRVVGFRVSLVFGSMTLAMAVGGVLGQLFGAAPVIGAFGVLTLVAGLAGLLVPAVRDA
ncbi:MAG: MFS transporter [Chloroflexota bacterium]|nr:MFS transporter [Chloroflexota bacterium]